MKKYLISALVGATLLCGCSKKPKIIIEEVVKEVPIVQYIERPVERTIVKYVERPETESRYVEREPVEKQERKPVITRSETNVKWPPEKQVKQKWNLRPEVIERLEQRIQRHINGLKSDNRLGREQARKDMRNILIKESEENLEHITKNITKEEYEEQQNELNKAEKTRNILIYGSSGSIAVYFEQTFKTYNIEETNAYLTFYKRNAERTGYKFGDTDIAELLAEVSNEQGIIDREKLRNKNKIYPPEEIITREYKTERQVYVADEVSKKYLKKIYQILYEEELGEWTLKQKARVIRILKKLDRNNNHRVGDENYYYMQKYYNELDSKQYKHPDMR